MENPDKVRRWKRESYARNPDAHKARVLWSEFGITFEQYNEMLERQEELCAICQEPETATLRGTVRRLCVDHDHETGHVRGLLCTRCNTGIGLLGSNIEAAIGYLEAAQVYAREMAQDGVNIAGKYAPDA